MTALTQSQVRSRMLMMSSDNTEILVEWDDQLSLDTAAQQSRLTGDKITPQEAVCFPDIINGHLSTQKLYLYLRNRILQLWLQNCRQQLTLNKCNSEINAPYNCDLPLIKRIHAFLERYGFINFGIFEISNPFPKQKCRIVIIGAGIAGLTAARQLQTFGCDVIVLEGRDRIGGRIDTYQKGVFVADLGAMIVTGLGGNPMSVIARQIPVEMQKIRTKCPLYVQSGATVSKEQDQLVETEFNKLLDASAYMAHSMDFSEIDNRPMSLGKALDLLIKIQDKYVKERQIEYWKTVVELQEKLKNNFHNLLRLQEQIRVLNEEYRASLAERDKSDQKSVGGLESSSADDEHPSAAALDELDSSTSEAIAEFMVRSKRRDLAVACRQHSELLECQREFEESLREMDRLQPSELYLHDLDKQVLDWHIANLEFANATTVHNLSLKYWDQDDEFELSGSHLSIQNGYRIIPMQFAKDLTIRQHTRVSAVRYDTQGVEVDVVTPAGTHDIVKGDCVLCTIPLGVLKHSVQKAQQSVELSCTPKSSTSVKFEPPLPEWKCGAIERVGFGCLNKVVLCFDRIFWDPTINVFGHVNTTSEAKGEFFQFWALSKAPVLLGLIAGEAALVLENLPDEIIRGRAMAVLRGIFGVVPEPKDVVVTRWLSDPWSRGSYSYVGVNASGVDYDLLADPVAPAESVPARVFFAGEHTIRNYPATVHGAMLSGFREAGRIADQLLGAPYLA